MFLGTHEPKLDEKGRLILPARFRDELADGLVEDEQIKQLALGERASGWQQADQAVDRIKSRFGRGSLRPARLVQDHEEE